MESKKQKSDFEIEGGQQKAVISSPKWKCENCRAETEIHKWMETAKGFQCPCCNHVQQAPTTYVSPKVRARVPRPYVKIRPTLSIDAKERIQLSVHQVPIETMIQLAEQFGAKPDYRTESGDSRNSYSVIEIQMANIVVTFYSIHLHKPRSA